MIAGCLRGCADIGLGCVCRAFKVDQVVCAGLDAQRQGADSAGAGGADIDGVVEGGRVVELPGGLVQRGVEGHRRVMRQARGLEHEDLVQLDAFAQPKRLGHRGLGVAFVAQPDPDERVPAHHHDQRVEPGLLKQAGQQSFAGSPAVTFGAAVKKTGTKQYASFVIPIFGAQMD